MALSIKNKEVDRLVREVCSLTGESMTSAIEVALRQRLEQISQSTEEYVKGIRELQADLASTKTRIPSMAEFDDAHYDEAGLPR